MLPSLQKLDDRGVRDRERQAALIHFSSSQATEMTPHPLKKESPSKAPHPRVELTAKLGKPAAVDSDDVALLDLVALKEGDLSRRRPLTGSSAKEPAMEEYSLEMLKSLSSQDDTATRNGVADLPPPGKKRPSSLPPPRSEGDLLSAHKDKYPNIPSLPVPDLPPRKRNDPNLQYQDELEAYSKYKSRGFFTPHPNKGEEEDRLGESSQLATDRGRNPSATEAGQEGERDRERALRRDMERRRQAPDDGGDGASRHRHRTHTAPDTETFPVEGGVPDPSRSSQQTVRPSAGRYDVGVIQSRLDDSPSSKHILFRVLDLVDRYWNGSKSLHQHPKFLGLALDTMEEGRREGPLMGMQQDIKGLKQRVQRLQEENSCLREQQSRRGDADTTSTSEVQLKATLKQARSDVELLREELQHYVRENARLQRKLEQQQESAASCNVSGAASSANPLHLDDIQRQNEALSREIEGLRSRLKQYAQMQELASMLQESHKSLVHTNDHLLKEMEEERRRHRHEVEQMHWSYDQLKKTISYLPSTIKGDSTLNANSTSVSAPPYRDSTR